MSRSGQKLLSGSTSVNSRAPRTRNPPSCWNPLGISIRLPLPRSQPRQCVLPVRAIDWLKDNASQQRKESTTEGPDNFVWHFLGGRPTRCVYFEAEPNTRRPIPIQSEWRGFQEPCWKSHESALWLPVDGRNPLFLSQRRRTRCEPTLVCPSIPHDYHCESLPPILLQGLNSNAECHYTVPL